jgi:hypothetical protein
MAAEMAFAYPREEKSCHFLETSPFFLNRGNPAISHRAMNDMEVATLRNELIFLTELSRFLNKKAPMLLQVLLIIISIHHCFGDPR